MARMSRRAVTSTSAASTTTSTTTSTTEALQTDDMRKDQNDVLHGIGSQFPVIDDAVQNMDLHPNL
ncbi:hypothetical protein J3F84DRAFT_344018 [Trichoderma pleuroticola]